MVEVTVCRARKDRNLFERMPELLLGSHENFVPPFPGSIAKFLKSDAPFQRRHGSITGLLAWRDGKPVGRVAAIVNRSHNSHHRDRAGFFGFFECEDNQESARVLLDRAAEILRQEGLDSIRGPYNPSVNDECGLMVRGFEHQPYLGLPWNPEYYQQLVMGAGLSPIRTLYGYLLALHKLEAPERLSRLAKHVACKSSMKLRQIDMTRLEEELEIVHEVYNYTLERNWGFVPISMEELLGAAADMKAIADPAMILIAERDGEPAGVALSLPNFNEILARVKRTPCFLRLPHILWLMKTHHIRSARQVVYGILPGFRDRGLHAWLLHEQFVCAKARFQNAELGWVEESNTEIRENCTMIGGINHRLWKIYEKPLVPPSGK